MKFSSVQYMYFWDKNQAINMISIQRILGQRPDTTSSYLKDPWTAP